MLAKAQQDENPGVLIHAFKPDDELGVFTWTDAAWANRVKEASTGGYLACLAPKRMSQGTEEGISFIHWHSGKLKR
eukprot:12261302-Alexandrium_andersonii.AAC.1